MARADTARALCHCGAPKARPHHKLCRACYLASHYPTPLRRWRTDTGQTFAWLARETGVSERAIARIAAGEAAKTSAIALKIHKVTRIPLAELMKGT